MCRGLFGARKTEERSSGRDTVAMDHVFGVYYRDDHTALSPPLLPPHQPHQPLQLAIVQHCHRLLYSTRSIYCDYEKAAKDDGRAADGGGVCGPLGRPIRSVVGQKGLGEEEEIGRKRDDSEIGSLVLYRIICSPCVLLHYFINCWPCHRRGRRRPWSITNF